MCLRINKCSKHYGTKILLILAIILQIIVTVQILSGIMYLNTNVHISVKCIQCSGNEELVLCGQGKD